MKANTGVPVTPWTVVMSTVFLASEYDVRNILVKRLADAIWFYELRGHTLHVDDKTRLADLVRDASSVNVPSGTVEGLGSSANVALGMLVEKEVQLDIETIDSISAMVRKIELELTAPKSLHTT